MKRWKREEWIVVVEGGGFFGPYKSLEEAQAQAALLSSETHIDKRTITTTDWERAGPTIAPIPDSAVQEDPSQARRAGEQDRA